MATERIPSSAAAVPASSPLRLPLRRRDLGDAALMLVVGVLVVVFAAVLFLVMAREGRAPSAGAAAGFCLLWGLVGAFLVLGGAWSAAGVVVVSFHGRRLRIAHVLGRLVVHSTDVELSAVDGVDLVEARRGRGTRRVVTLCADGKAHGVVRVGSFAEGTTTVNEIVDAIERQRAMDAR